MSNNVFTSLGFYPFDANTDILTTCEKVQTHGRSLPCVWAFLFYLERARK
nr:MAG TPA: hypothetical protein [Caudoviricetes sp.]